MASDGAGLDVYCLCNMHVYAAKDIDDDSIDWQAVKLLAACPTLPKGDALLLECENWNYDLLFWKDIYAFGVDVGEDRNRSE